MMHVLQCLRVTQWLRISGTTKTARVTRQAAPILYLFEIPIAVQPASPSIPRDTLMKKTLLATLLLASLPLAVQAEDNDVNTRPDVYYMTIEAELGNEVRYGGKAALLGKIKN